MEYFDLRRKDGLIGRSREIRRRRKRWALLLGALLIGLFLIFYQLILPSLSPPPSEIPSESTSQMTHELQYHTVEGDIRKRSSLFQSLIEKNVPIHWINLIVSKLEPYVDFKRIKGGTYQLIMDVKGELIRFIYEASPTEVYEIEKNADGYFAYKKEIPLETRITKVGGEIQSSLFEAMDAIGEGDALTIAFAEILAWEIDFYKDVRQGDRFKLVVEKFYKGDQFIQYGKIYAVEYQGEEKTVRGIYYNGGYYNEKGHSLKKAFLKAPLRFNRISSRFSQARRHPILGGVRPHFGVDYAAPVGTPIWAVSDGVVTFCGWNKGFGRQVIIRHLNGYQTYYGHLSGFGPGIRKGVRVKQQQIIGYVGSTGLSTGPHLDYRLSKNGRFRNPLKETFPAGLPIDKREMEKFIPIRDEMLLRLQEGPIDSEAIKGRGDQRESIERGGYGKEKDSHRG